ncbi:MAG: UDP-glucose/GDP-mannose dehydrogenase family protein [Phycisphaerae bacterium]
MKIAVVGIWHLGSVYAACLAAAGHEVTAMDEDESVVEGLREGRLPVDEPGLAELWRQWTAGGRLRCSSAAAAVAGADIVWITYDTPVDDQDRADVEFVVERVMRLFRHLDDGTTVVVSSQLPVGTTARLEKAFAACGGARKVDFAYSPENLRLGSAIDAFTKADRFVVGVRSQRARQALQAALGLVIRRIEWMSVESAEMTKHATNAFLATSVVFMNEIARICERVGADAAEVGRALKSDARIGPRAYLRPGGAFAGGTLARDIAFLVKLGQSTGADGPFFDAVYGANERHKGWPLQRLRELVGPLPGRKVAVLGLTYKPGTDTLRRSSSVELCLAAAREGAAVTAYDPAVRALPAELAPHVRLADSLAAAMAGAEAAVVMTEWPQFRQVTADDVLRGMAQPVIVDAGGLLADRLGVDERIRYVRVGKGA